MIFNLALYDFEIRTTDGSHFEKWPLTFMFLGKPLGASKAGYIIKRTQKVIGLLFVNSLLSLVVHTSLTAGWISAHVESRIRMLLSEESSGSKDARFVPSLIVLFINLCVSLSGLIVALLCIVKKEGK